MEEGGGEAHRCICQGGKWETDVGSVLDSDSGWIFQDLENQSDDRHTAQEIA